MESGRLRPIDPLGDQIRSLDREILEKLALRLLVARLGHDSGRKVRDRQAVLSSVRGMAANLGLEVGSELIEVVWGAIHDDSYSPGGA